MSDIQVSIVCNTYNQEKYIRQCLESLISQKTNFDYEVLVHDDASTDSTASIVREFEERYPGIVKPIYQTENQYSKKISISRNFQYPRAKGKYIAMCEGDDYWIDEFKIQKQFDAMEKNPDIDICAHSAIVVAGSKNKKMPFKTTCPKNRDCVITTEEVILGGGGYVATNSLFFRSELMKDIPEFRKKHSYDYSLQIHGALRGGMLFLHDTMSAYRYCADGSWTRSMQSNKEKAKKFQIELSNMLDNLDKETNQRYHNAIVKRKRINEFYRRMGDGETNPQLIREYKDVFSDLSPRARIITFMKCHFPNIIKTYKKSLMK